MSFFYVKESLCQKLPDYSNRNLTNSNWSPSNTYISAQIRTIQIVASKGEWAPAASELQETSAFLTKLMTRNRVTLRKKDSRTHRATKL